MKKILLLKAAGRFLLSIATAFVVVAGLVSILGIPKARDAWRAEKEFYVQWLNSDAAKVCAQVRTLSSREALVRAGLVTSCESSEDVYEYVSKVNPYVTSFPHELQAEVVRGYQQACEDAAKLQESQLWSNCDDERRPPAPLKEYTRKYLVDGKGEIVVAFLSVMLVIFVSLSSGRLFLTEVHLGWKRVSLVIGTFASLVAPISVALSESRLNDEAVVLGIASALAAFPLAILLVLGGKRIAGWMRDGFRSDDVTPFSALQRVGAERSTEAGQARDLPNGGAAPATRPSAPRAKRKVAARIGLVVLAAVAASLPGAFVDNIVFMSPVPLWFLSYRLLEILAGAVGAGLIPMVFGGLVLLARRNRPDGGLKAAVIVTLVLGAFVSFAFFNMAFQMT